MIYPLQVSCLQNTVTKKIEADIIRYHPLLCYNLTEYCLPLAQGVLDRGIRSIAVVFKHAALYPDHEKAVGELARGMGFTQVGILGSGPRK